MDAKKTIHKGSNLGPRHEGPKLDPLCLLLLHTLEARKQTLAVIAYQSDNTKAQII